MRVSRLMVLTALAAGGCGGQVSVDDGASTSAALSASEQHGHDVWFKSTFGGEKFFSLILPQAPFNLPVGFDDIISIDPELPELLQLQMELSQPTYKLNNAGKIIVEKAPDGTRSPNLADAVMITFNPATRSTELWKKLGT